MLGRAEITKSNYITNRELEVLQLLTYGYSNSEIAAKLFITNHTVKAHLESIYAKFSVSNRLQASVYAIKNGIIKM